jgi:glutathione synthase/RimK-type ligase-like ATP-grasp enzyme
VRAELFVHRFLLVARNGTMTNQGLVGAAQALGLDAVMLPPEEAKGDLDKGDVVLGRLDVRTTLDGPEPGLEALRALEKEGELVLNRAGPLLEAHDKLASARIATGGAG